LSDLRSIPWLFLYCLVIRGYVPFIQALHAPNFQICHPASGSRFVAWRLLWGGVEVGGSSTSVAADNSVSGTLVIKRIFGEVPQLLREAARGDGIWNYNLATDYYFSVVNTTTSGPSPLADFVNFTNLFLGSQGGKNCPGNSCSAGIYMYVYIPQTWYSQ